MNTSEAADAIRFDGNYFRHIRFGKNINFRNH